MAALNALRQPWLDAFFAAVTWLGSIVVLLPAALALAWQSWQRGQGIAAHLLPSSVAGAWALAHLGKVLIERPRPDLFPTVIAMPADPSFPSAHAMQITAFALAWLLAPHQRAGWEQIIAAAILWPYSLRHLGSTCMCIFRAMSGLAWLSRWAGWSACGSR